MSISKVRTIVNAVIAIKGTGTRVFNDPITNGRSIKVWGWSEMDYQFAMSMLIKAGYRVTLVRGYNIRLHVTGRDL